MHMYMLFEYLFNYGDIMSCHHVLHDIESLFE